MKKSKPFKSDRRRALRGLATSPALAAGAAAAVTSQVHAEPLADATAQVTTDKGYQETQHVRDYYRTASF